MTAASSVYKTVAYKRNAGAYGAAPGRTGGQLLTRTSSDISLTKDAYSSARIRPELQRANSRHGVRRVPGKISDELSCKTFADFFAALVKRDFTAGVSEAGVGLTIAGSGPTYTVTRSAGNYLTAGWKKGRVKRLSVGSLNAANLNKNLLIVDLTATVATVVVLNGSALVAEGPIAGCTLTEVGKSTWVPTSGHVERDFGIEEWHSDINVSDLYLGVKVTKATINLPPTGNATVDFDLIGQDMADTTAKREAVALNTQYFTSPTAPPATGIMQAVNGVLRGAGGTLTSITGLSIEVSAAYRGNPVVGQNTIPNQFAGQVTVSGQITAYFDSTTLRDAFINETEFDLMGAFTADNTAAADFIGVTMHRVKANGATKSDGEDGVMLTIPYEALLNTAGGTGTATEATTISFQDAQA